MKIYMKVLIITEKCHPNSDQRDGGARVIDTLKHFLKGVCDIMQFGGTKEGCAKYYYNYPDCQENRFERRLSNREFIGQKVQEISNDYSHLIFIHISMQFGLEVFPVEKGTVVWTFPMFLTPSYRASGETIPKEYFEAEKRALTFSHAILTPSLFEKRQIHDIYGIDEEKIFMVPRGIDASLISRNTRKLSSTFLFCSVGSIKPQKNTLELVNLFAAVQKRFPSALLRLIGPVQDHQYAMEVLRRIKQLTLEQQVEFSGFVEPKGLVKALSDCHFHLSASWCETFGRSIFETLALGIPNIAFQGDHAAQDFLSERPYMAFVDNKEDAVSKIEEMIESYEELSVMAEEIGELYCDDFLGRLLTATLFSDEILGVCDFDGTLFHKNDEDKTYRSLSAFRRFPVRVICSARPLSSLLLAIKSYDLEVDWVIAHSGALVADGSGNVKWETPLTKRDLVYLEQKTGCIFAKDQKRLQVALPKDKAPDIPFLRKEMYQEMAYFNHWKASKLNALCQLLKEIDWKGRVAVYGDGIYDREMITYFDGQWINPQPILMGQQKELNYV